MITFFRRLRRSFLSAGLKQKYVFYALGEIALVVIGILIALQINNWNEWRKEHHTLKGYLEFMIEDIDSDKAQLEKLINDRESSLALTTQIINAYKSQESIVMSDFLQAINLIVLEQRFENNTNGFDKALSSKMFDSEQFLTIRNLIRDYKKIIDDLSFREDRHNAAIESMESELLRNGYYDSVWSDFRAFYQPDYFQRANEDRNVTEDINRYGELKAIFLRNEWVMPFVIRDYRNIISLGESLSNEIQDYLNNTE